MKKAFFLILLVLSLLLISCENFMNGSDVQDQLNEMIDVANAKSYTIIVYQDNTMGSFLSAGDKSCKQGQSFDVQYTVKKDLYIYKGLKAVSKSDETVSRNDCVEFTVLDKDDQRGVYKTSIKLVKESDDVLIIPDCVLVPNVDTAACKPDSNAVSEQDSTVSIAFNKPVKVVDFLDLSINDSSGQNLIDYFGEPYFSADSKNLLIPVNSQKHLIGIKEPETTTKEVIVKLNLSSIQDMEGNKGNGVITHKYRVNNKRDDVVPVLTGAKLYSTNDTKNKYYKELTDKGFDDWSATGDNNGDYGKNHVTDSIYVEIEGTDVGSGIAGFLVKEKLFKNYDGSAGASAAATYHAETKATEVKDHYAATYKFNTMNDGVIELEFFAEDNAGNLSQKSIKFYVIKDTKIDSGFIKFNEEIGQFPDTSAGWKAAVPVVEGDIQNVSITLSENAKDYWYSGAECVSDYDIQAFWGYSDDGITNPVTVNGNKYTFTRDVKKLVYIKLICKDEIGNEKEIIKRMDPRPEITWDYGQLKVINKEMLFIKNNNIKLLTESEMTQITKYGCLKFVFYDDETNPSEVIINNNSYGYYDSVQYITKAWESLNKASDYTGRVDVYVITNLSDFPSPLSLNYCKYNVEGWDDQEGWGYRHVSLESNEPVLSSGNGNGLEYVDSFGPENTPYLKDNIKIKTESKSGCYMVTISDYMTEAGKAADLNYTFYAVPFEGKDYSGQEEVSDQDLHTIWTTEMNTIKSSEPELFLPSKTTYIFFITASDSENVYGPCDNPFITGNWGIDDRDKPGFKFYLNNETTLKNELKLADDLTAPYINWNEGFNEKTQMFASQGGYTINSPMDAGNMSFNTEPEDSLYRNEKGNYEFTYYIIPNIADSINQVPSYTVSELESNYASFAKTFEIEGSIPYELTIPYGNIEEGYYTISIVLKDKNGNTAVYTYPFLNKSLGKLPYTKEFTYQHISSQQRFYNYNFTIDDEDENHPEIKIKTVNGKEIPTISAQVILLQKITDKYEWLAPYDLCYSFDGTTRQPTFETQMPLGSNGNLIMDNGSWAKLHAYYGFDDSSVSVKGKGFYDTEYVFLSYDLSQGNYIDGEDFSWYTCKLKNCFDGLNGIQIFADNSVFVHTMYSSDKLTESRLDKNAAAIWENKGIETGVEVYKRDDPTFESVVIQEANPEIPGSQTEYGYHLVDAGDTTNVTYDLSHYDSIPTGCWYTTILHFVDGTVLMTDIKQK